MIDLSPRLDRLVQLAVQQINAEVPPSAPTPGAAWAGQGTQIAIWQGAEAGGGWLFIAP